MKLSETYGVNYIISYQKNIDCTQILSIRSHESVSVNLFFLWRGGKGGGGGGEWELRPMDWTMIASGLIQMLDANSDVCNYLLFLHPFNHLNLIFTYYSSVTSWCVLSGTSSVAINGSLYRFCLYGLSVHFGKFPLSDLLWEYRIELFFYGTPLYPVDIPN